MCGIAGFLDLDPARSAEALHARLRCMTDRIVHRGPDGEDAWVDERAGVALGHRRLAVIDLSPTGNQPMASADGRYLITYNGEIYNFRSIRAELEARGHHFRGASDSEVLIEAIAAFGLRTALQRIVGMFAFGLWDRHERRLTLVRDRLGVKPLFWARTPDGFQFASELKAMLALPDWQPQLDRPAVAGLLRYGYVTGERSVLVDVAKVAPGGLVVLASDGTVTRDTWWDLGDVVEAGARDPFLGTDDEATSALEEVLREAVRDRMVADVPLGAFLSGGVDSSAVVALMQAQSSTPVRTFCIGFDDPSFDESPHARAVADHLGTDHHDVEVTARDALDVVPCVADWFDEPFADPSQIPTFLVARMARQHVTVSLSGDGGDELFAGYPRYALAADLWRRVQHLPMPVRQGLGATLGTLPERWLDAAARGLPPRWRLRAAGAKLHRAGRVMTAGSIDLLHRDLAAVWPCADRLVGTGDGVRLTLDGSIDGVLNDPVARMQYHDMRTYLPDDILTKLDRTSMAVSLEAREPLLDHRLVAFVWRLDPSLKLRGTTTKWLLRRVLDRYVPRSLIERPKMGFSVPMAAWLRGPLRAWAEELLAPSRLLAGGVLDGPRVRRLWDDHQSGRANREAILWNLLVFQAWQDRYGVA
ncbi:MAG: asparagine synthase (glutamine-hydrolyzing) [Pseudomonadota bacterium]